MSSVGNVSGPIAADASLPVNQGVSSTRVQGSHSQFSKVSVGGVNTDFLEEASIAISSLRKFESKDDKKDKDLKKQLERAKDIVPDIPGIEKMDKFLQQLQGARKNGQLSDDQIKEFAGDYSGDPSHQYLALDALIEHLQSGDGEQRELAATLKDFNTRSYQENKKDIQSGINVSSAAAKYVEQSGYGSVQELRDIWRQGLDVPDFQQPLEAYQFAIEKSGYEGINEGIKWLREALSTEMHALTKSVDPNHMNHVRSRLEVVYGLGTMIERGKQDEATILRMIKANG